MNEQINTKRVLFYTLMGAVLFSGIYLFVNPQPAQKSSKFENFFKEINEKQKIAPKSLYVNAWRKIKNEYYDTSMNSQNWQRWRYKYLKQIETIEDADVAINTMISSLNDPCSAFLRTEMYQKQKVINDANVTGIGASVKKSDKGFIVNNLVKDSPADNSSVSVGDLILKVNDIDLTEVSLSDIASLMSASGGKMVRVQIMRNGQVLEKDILVKNFDIKNMLYLITDDNIGYIRVENFMGDSCADEFKTMLEKTGNTKGIIIDLRNNYGGILTNAINMADLMISDDLIVSLESRGGYLYKIFAKPDIDFVKKPIVILTNNSTASSAEILAGTLRDNLGALLVGEQTYGKNTIQKITPLQNMTGLVLTNGKYILPKGEDINGVGLIPDIIVSNDIENKDTQLDVAFETISVILENPQQLGEFIEKSSNNQLSNIIRKKSTLQNIYRVNKKTKLI